MFDIIEYRFMPKTPARKKKDPRGVARVIRFPRNGPRYQRGRGSSGRIPCRREGVTMPV